VYFSIVLWQWQCAMVHSPPSLIDAGKKQNFHDDLSNSGLAVRLYREGRATGGKRRPLDEHVHKKKNGQQG
jgi:hypothetical protein